MCWHERRTRIECWSPPIPTSGELLARSGDAAPSVLLLRRHDRRRVHALAELILANLDAIEADLADGALIVFDQELVRIRRLPIGGA